MTQNDGCSVVSGCLTVGGANLQPLPEGIGIGAAECSSAVPLPHHRAYGSRTRRFKRLRSCGETGEPHLVKETVREHCFELVSVPTSGSRAQARLPSEGSFLGLPGPAPPMTLPHSICLVGLHPLDEMGALVAWTSEAICHRGPRSSFPSFRSALYSRLPSLASMASADSSLRTTRRPFRR